MPPTTSGRRGLVLIAAAIVLTALNLRTMVNSVGPVLPELAVGLGLSSGLTGLVTALPVLCFAASATRARRCRPGTGTRTSSPARCWRWRPA